MARKRKKENKTDDGKNDGSSYYGAAAYLPPKPTGEDDNSTSKHQAALKVEFKSKNPNLDRVNLLMQRTLYDRRQKVVDKGQSVGQLIEEYPWLARQLPEEYKRITDIDITLKVSEFLLEYATEVVTSFEGIKKNKEHFINTLIPKDENMTEAEAKYATECKALLAVSALLGEDPL